MAKKKGLCRTEPVPEGPLPGYRRLSPMCVGYNGFSPCLQPVLVVTKWLNLELKHVEEGSTRPSWGLRTGDGNHALQVISSVSGWTEAAWCCYDFPCFKRSLVR